MKNEWFVIGYLQVKTERTTEVIITYKLQTYHDTWVLSVSRVVVSHMWPPA